ncbi:MAG: inner-membrane translocator [Chloroflexi bacterium OLB15]|nr:MAG: inner-membrane translocator [Chloroflexi bacterium OLB15]
MNRVIQVRTTSTNWLRAVGNRLLDVAPLLVALILAFLVGSVLLLALNVSPLAGFSSMLQGAFGSENTIAETLVKATPMLLVAIGICISFRGGMINVGGEGQMIAGAVAGVTVALALSTSPSLIAVPLSIFAGFLAGAIYGGLAGWLKAYFNVNEILSTIMLNAIAVQMMNYLLNGPLLDPTEAGVNHVPKTARIAEQLQIARLSIPLPEGVAELFSLQNAELFARTRLHWGLIIAIVLAVLAYFLLWRTTIGYRIRAVGENERAAKYAGIRVRWNMVLAMLFAGGFAGLAGVVQVLGLQYRLQTDGSATGFTANAGFNGIVAALFGGLNPLGAIPASIFFGGLLVGAQKMQRDLGVPAALITSLNGLIVIFAVSSEYFRAALARRRSLGGGSMSGAQPVTAPPETAETRIDPGDSIGLVSS